METLRFDAFHSTKRPFYHFTNMNSFDDSFNYPLHRHLDFGEIVVIFDGEMEHRINDQVHIHRPGEGVIIYQGDSHAVNGRASSAGDGISGESMFRFANIILPGPLTPREITGILESRGERKFSLERDRLIRLLGDLEELIIEKQEEAYCCKYYEILYRLCGYLAKSPEERETAYPAWLSELMARISSSAEIPKTRELPGLSGVTAEHLSRTFRKYLNTSPSSWLNDRRLERGANLLKRTNYRIIDIGFRLGFRRIEHFQRLFKRKYRISPQQYRKRESSLL